MSEYTQEHYRAILVPYERFDADHIVPVASAYTQAGGSPGLPVPDQATPMILEATGTTDGRTLEVECAQGGHPGPDGSARILWRDVATSVWYGYDQPSLQTGWQSLLSESDTGRTNRYPVALPTRDGALLVGFHQLAASVSYYQIRRITSDGTATTITVDSDGGTQRHRMALCQLPSGRILLYRWRLTLDGHQVWCHRSDDDGATWSLHARDCLPEAEGDTVYRLCAVATTTGQVALFCHMHDTSTAYDDEIAQYVSDNGGASFGLVYRGDGSAAATSQGYPDATPLPDGGILLLYGQKGQAAAHVARLPGAGYPMDAAEPVTVSGVQIGVETANVYTSGDAAIERMADGTTWIVGHNGTIYRSTDDGVTWDGWPLWQDRISTSYGPAEIALCEWRGRAVAVCNYETVAGAENWAIYLADLGGWTTAPIATPYEGARWSYLYHGTDVPGSVGWTATGTATAELASTRLSTTVTAPNVRRYRRDNLGAAASGQCILASVHVVSGTCWVGMLYDDGSNRYEIQAQIASTGSVQGYDVQGAANVGSAATGYTGRIDVLIAMDGANAEAAIYIRQHAGDEDDAERRTFSLLCHTDTLTAGATSANEAYAYVQCGNAAVNSGLDWYFAGVSPTNSASEAIDHTVLASTQDRAQWRGRQVSADAPSYLGHGVSLRGMGGHAAYGDTWQIAPRYAYGVDAAILGTPSRGWRTTQTSSAEQVTWDITGDVGGRRRFSGYLGIYLDRINWPVFRIHTSPDNTPTWTQRYSGSMVSSVSYTLHGDVMEVADPTALGWLAEGDLDGGHVRLGVGGSEDLRRIVHSREAQSSASGKKMPLRLTLDGIDGTEDTSGTAYVWPSRCLIICHIDQDTEIQYVRLTLSGRSTLIGTWPAPPHGRFEVGTIAIGDVIPIGYQPSASQSRIIDTQADLQTDGAGVTVSRLRGPARQTLELQWLEGVDYRPARLGDSDWVSGSDATDAYALRHQTIARLSALAARHDWPHTPIVYLPRIEFPDAGESQIYSAHRVDGAIYGRAIGPFRREALMGDEGEAVERFALTIREEI